MTLFTPFFSKGMSTVTKATPDGLKQADTADLMKTEAVLHRGSPFTTSSSSPICKLQIHFCVSHLTSTLALTAFLIRILEISCPGSNKLDKGRHELRVCLLV